MRLLQVGLPQASRVRLDWFRLYPGRWELCHAKDEAKTAKGETVEVGDGVIDFKTIFGKKMLKLF